MQAKNEEANEKLKQMVKDQQEAEKQKQQSIEISILVEQQTKDNAIKRKEVMRDLERVEPAVIDAQNAVKSIKKTAPSGGKVQLLEWLWSRSVSYMARTLLIESPSGLLP